MVVVEFVGTVLLGIWTSTNDGQQNVLFKMFAFKSPLQELTYMEPLKVHFEEIMVEFGAKIVPTKDKLYIPIDGNPRKFHNNLDANGLKAEKSIDGNSRETTVTLVVEFEVEFVGMTVAFVGMTVALVGVDVVAFVAIVVFVSFTIGPFIKEMFPMTLIISAVSDSLTFN